MNLKKLNIDADLSYRDIGAELGCSDFTVMKIEQTAINKIQAILNEKGLTFEDVLGHIYQELSFKDYYTIYNWKGKLNDD